MIASEGSAARFPDFKLPHRLVAEGLGTCFLLIAVVGSGILGVRLAQGNTAVALTANALATAAALYALIEWLGPLSGAHFNPLVTAALVIRGDLSVRTGAAYVPVQLVGAVAGVGMANAMFAAPVFSLSVNDRSGFSNLLSEFVSTFGLLGAVWVCSRLRPASVAGVVAAYIGGAFWFTATDFANPAVTIARAFTDSFAGIRPQDILGFIMAEVLGAAVAIVVFRWLLPSETPIETSDPNLSDARSVLGAEIRPNRPAEQPASAVSLPSKRATDAAVD
ncbi:MIP/aquaporin family protein [Bradyrhizobium cosmicum]|uniref:MIP/aquaporin family protein n=1 Tax=Bradyrhizobium cosmicum TaxID=1404864 RepID=UPI0028E4472A|nr:MIP/aquaporin family protein [Bradyrhizobium cosmicum]